MPRLPATVSMLFTEVAFLDRFERAAQAGRGWMPRASRSPSDARQRG